jgi:hypothetical protein
MNRFIAAPVPGCVAMARGLVRCTSTYVACSWIGLNQARQEGIREVGCHRYPRPQAAACCSPAIRAQAQHSSVLAVRQVRWPCGSVYTQVGKHRHARPVRLHRPQVSVGAEPTQLVSSIFATHARVRLAVGRWSMNTAATGSCTTALTAATAEPHERAAAWYWPRFV